MLYVNCVSVKLGRGRQKLLLVLVKLLFLLDKLCNINYLKHGVSDDCDFFLEAKTLLKRPSIFDLLMVPSKETLPILD